MQLDDKLVEGRDAAQIELQQREEMEARGDEQLPAPIIEAMRDADVERRNQLVGAMRMILENQTLTVAQLRLPPREAMALEALQAATTGRGDLGEFLFAEDRRDLLERALTVLQPNAVNINDASALELQAQLDDVGEKVASLRETIAHLEDAQDEVREEAQKQAFATQTDPADKPKPKPAPSDPDAPRPPTTLTGPARPEPKPLASTLDGPARPEPTPLASTLDGPALPEPAPLASTLDGPARPASSPLPSSLDGDAPPEPAKPPSTLGDPADLAEQAKKPWWRRPFG